MPKEDKECFVLFTFLTKSIDLLLDFYYIFEICKSSQHVDESTKQWMVVCTIWGTILLWFTLLILCYDYCKDIDDVNRCSTFPLFLSTLTEDLPKFILAIDVVREETRLISRSQWVKAVYGFIKHYLRIHKIASELDSSKKTTRNVSQFIKCMKSLDKICCCGLCMCSFVLSIVLLLLAN